VYTHKKERTKLNDDDEDDERTIPLNNTLQNKIQMILHPNTSSQRLNEW